MVESRVMSDTPACFFLKPSLQSALATPFLPAAAEPDVPAPELGCAAAALRPAFLEIACWEGSADQYKCIQIGLDVSIMSYHRGN